MMTKTKGTAIPGSTKAPLPGATAIAAAPPDERLEVTVRLRPKTPLPTMRDMLALSSTPIPILTHDEYEKKYGSPEADFALVRKFAKANNLIVVRESTARRSVMLSGTVSDF